MVGRVRQLGEVAFDGPAGLFAIGRDDRRALLNRDLAGREGLSLVTFAQLALPAGRAQVAHPVGLATRADQVAGALMLGDDHRHLVDLAGLPPGHRQGRCAADSEHHRQRVEHSLHEEVRLQVRHA